jgi:hypothetical protein
MRPSQVLSAFAVVAAAVSPATAADLSEIDRIIVKEPAYQSKAAKYCLLVFGPEAKTRVWLVQDGDKLYVDRNGSGDLTEPGKQVSAQKGDDTDSKDGVCTFEAGDIQDGNRLHKNLTLSVVKLDDLAERDAHVKAYLSRDPRVRGYLLGIDAEIPGWTGTAPGGRVRQQMFYRDGNGILKLAEKPQNAPVIHLGGPWQVSLFGRQELVIGRERDLVLALARRAWEQARQPGSPTKT